MSARPGANPDAEPPSGTAVAVEICVDDVAGAAAAAANGADRVELCAALAEGGVTPSLGLVTAVFDRVPAIGVQVMIRPRGGDFTADPAELDVMLADIALIRAHAPPDRLGFVFGVLDAADRIDRAALDRLVAACGPAPTTFHKAFDRIADQDAALDELAAAGVGAVLTSGGAPTAAAGAEQLRRLVAQADGRLTVMAGGGVRAGNVRALIERTRVPAVHLRAMVTHPTRPPVTSAEAIAAVVAAVRGAP